MKREDLQEPIGYNEYQATNGANHALKTAWRCLEDDSVIGGLIDVVRDPPHSCLDCNGACETLVVRLFFSTQEDPGNSIIFTFNDGGCFFEKSIIPGYDIFEEAGPDLTLEFSYEIFRSDYHFVRVSSDATAHYYIRVDVR